MPALKKLIIAGAFGATILFSFINMIISAILVSSYNSSEYPSTDLKNTTRFTLFVSIFNIVLGGAFIFFVLALGTSIIASLISLLGFTFLLWIFWVAAAASAETSLGGEFSCNNPDFAHCNQLTAMEAFSWINFIIYIVAFFMIAFFAFKSTRAGNGLTGPLSA